MSLNHSPFVIGVIGLGYRTRVTIVDISANSGQVKNEYEIGCINEIPPRAKYDAAVIEPGFADGRS